MRSILTAPDPDFDLEVDLDIEHGVESLDYIQYPIRINLSANYTFHPSFRPSPFFSYSVYAIIVVAF